MGIVSDALRDAPSDAHRRLWLAARETVRRDVAKLVVAGVTPSEILAVIADGNTELVFTTGGLVEAVDPHVAVLARADRGVVTAIWPSVSIYLPSVPDDSFAVLIMPTGERPMLAISRVVDCRSLS